MTGKTADRPKLTHDDYRVGWVCALPKEQTAAIAMLDQRHADLSKPPVDHNTYALGSIGQHNIVIACLPKGRLGTISAATVAMSMINTFPSIKFGFMVGIGGGIPPKVRLGDVVVSVPTGKYPGVVQWDMGKATEGGSFERTGALNNPPTMLLTALTALESEHELTGSKIPEYLDELALKWPRLASKYLKSDSMEDVLFKATYSHETEKVTDLDMSAEDEDQEDDDENEDNCRFCDKTKIVKRKPRDMRILFGLIASGNQVIKDAMFRNQLNKSLGGDVLCVEMEAAGLMNDFPCIVIRGICDYADSHKNKNWQEHAAAVAAAFAKELLGYVQLSEVAEARPAKEILGQLEEIKHNVNQLKRKLDRGEDLEILSWLAETDYGFQQSDYFNRRQPGTGKWLLASEKFKSWLETPGQTLFCPGIPGAGKTTLTAIVVDHLDNRFKGQPTVGIAYIYFNYGRKDEQTAHHVMASILQQLGGNQATMPEKMKKLFNQHKRLRTRPSLEGIMAALYEVTALFSAVFIILDALDEGTISETRKLLLHLCDLHNRCTVNVFATSRFVPEITKKFQPCPSLEIRARRSDVKLYLEGHILKLPSIVRDNQHLQEVIVARISDVVDGMFLLAKIYLDSLDDKITVKAIKTALDKFWGQANASKIDKAKVLADAYAQTMHRIITQRPGFRDIAIKVLSWLTYARERLTFPQFQHALATNVQHSIVDSDDLPELADVVSVCSGLVTLGAGNVIQFAHYTTLEYFVETCSHWFPNGQSDITETCLVYLSYCSKEAPSGLKPYHLFDYAARNWGHHARNASNVTLSVVNFLKDDENAVASYEALYASPSAKSRFFMAKAASKHLAALFGLPDVTRILVTGDDPDPVDMFGRTPLSIAVRKGHEGVVKALLDNGADIESTGASDRTPLLWACDHGRAAMAELLLNHGANINAQDDSGATPLVGAIYYGNDPVAKLLLQRGANIHLRDMFGRNALFYAIWRGDLTTVKVLLEKSGEIDQKHSCSKTAFNCAIETNKNILQLSLQGAANIVVENKDGSRDLLGTTEMKDNQRVVNILLETDTVSINTFSIANVEFIGTLFGIINDIKNLPEELKIVKEHLPLVQMVLTRAHGELQRSAINKSQREAILAILTAYKNSARKLGETIHSAEWDCRLLKWDFMGQWCFPEFYSTRDNRVENLMKDIMKNTERLILNEFFHGATHGNLEQIQAAIKSLSTLETSCKNSEIDGVGDVCETKIVANTDLAGADIFEQKCGHWDLLFVIAWMRISHYKLSMADEGDTSCSSWVTGRLRIVFNFPQGRVRKSVRIRKSRLREGNMGLLYTLREYELRRRIWNENLIQ